MVDIQALLRALPALPAGTPPGLPFEWDGRTVEAGLNFTLTTVAGDLDLEAVAELSALLEERDRGP